MKITVTDPSSGATTALEITDDITIETLRNLIEHDFQIPSEHQLLFVNSRRLNPSQNTQTLKQAGIEDGDVIVLSNSQLTTTSSLQTENSMMDAFRGTEASATSLDLFRNLNVSNILGSGQNAAEQDNKVANEVDALLARATAEPSFSDLIAKTHPEIASALKGRDRNTLIRTFKENNKKRHAELLERQRRWMQAVANPLHPESQKLLLEQVQQERIEESYLHAQEYLPESFANVFMLYVKIEVNHIQLKAFVDSGAQSTIMSRKCAEKCGLMRLIDARFSGIAQGVGTSRIVGRIHVVQIKMGNQFFAASVTVLEDDKVDFLFGLDLLRRHQCTIDLKDEVLRIGDEVLPFLSERETRGDIFSFGSEEMSNSVQQRTESQRTEHERTRISTRNNDVVQSLADASSFDRSGEEEKIKRLIDIGFSRIEALRALEATGGNVELAASLLF